MVLFGLSRRKLDELVENERPEIIPTHTHHGRHRHHHDRHDHKHRRHQHSNAAEDQDQEAIYNEKNTKMNNKQRHSSHQHHKDKSRSSTGHRHSSHKHHKHNHQRNAAAAAAVATNSAADDKMDLGGAPMTSSSASDNDMSNIYDSPKVPPIPVVQMNCELASSHDHDNNDETLQKQIPEAAVEVVYDVPRSNPRKVELIHKQQSKEAIYVNNNSNCYQETPCTGSGEEDHQDQTTYDVPRTFNNVIKVS